MLPLPAKRLIVAAALLSAATGCAVPPGPDTGQTVAYVDLQQYMGRWYAIASFPTWFQRNCHCVTASYSLQEDYVAVINTCRKGSMEGPLEVATAKAFVVPGTGNAQLKVQFFWPFKGDYWIIALADDDTWAVVGHPSRKYLWILNREPVMEAETYARLVNAAREKGYDVGRLERIPQGCGEDF